MKRESLWLSGIYCLAHFPLLLTTGYFYDDWVLYHPDPHMNIGLWWSTGRPLTGYFLNGLQALDGAFLARFVTFITYLLSGLFLLGVLRTIDLVDARARFFVVAVFMVFPADSTRILAMLACDALYFCLFFCGWWLTAAYMRNGNLLLRLASLCTFLGSFWLNSLLVFYSLVILYMLYIATAGKITLRSTARFIRNYADFLVIPVLFWLLQRLAFPPQGIDEGYNQFRLEGLWPLRWVSALKGSVVDPMVYSVIPLSLVWLGAVLLCTIFLFLMLGRRLPEPEQDGRRDLVLLIVGFFALFAALFPYLAVSKMPSYWDWLSRNARLVPLGVGLVLCLGVRVALTRIRVNSRSLLLANCLFLCVMISGNLRVYPQYWLDWYKAVSLVKEFKQSAEIKTHTTFLFKDECEDMNAKRRVYRFYEYGALMTLAFGEDSRFGDDEKRWDARTGLETLRNFLKELRNGPGGLNYTPAYFISQWVPRVPECRVRILAKTPRLGSIDLFKFKIAELLDSASFYATLPSLVLLEVERCSSEEAP
jgi:hypothetical protein